MPNDSYVGTINGLTSQHSEFFQTILGIKRLEEIQNEIDFLLTPVIK